MQHTYQNDIKSFAKILNDFYELIANPYTCDENIEEIKNILSDLTWRKQTHPELIDLMLSHCGNPFFLFAQSPQSNITEATFSDVLSLTVFNLIDDMITYLAITYSVLASQATDDLMKLTKVYHHDD